MSLDPPASGDRLAQALGIYHQYLDGQGQRDIDLLLQEHSALADLLEPLLRGDEPGTTNAEDVVIGGYRVLRELGRGGMGIIYEAEQVSLGRRVALKVLPSQALTDARAIARFKREAQLAACLDHPGITKVFETGQQGDQHWFAMELIRGVPLASLLDELRGDPADPDVAGQIRGRLTNLLEPSELTTPAKPAAPPVWATLIGIAIDMGSQMADALSCAHEAGIVHRDVKPGNILVRPDGSVVLSDFGIARSNDAIALTMTGDFAGTPSYSSPEQMRARPDELDHRTDIFSLGTTLYELLTLQKPFDADTISEVRQRIERQEPIAPSRWNRTVSRDLDAIVLHALEKNPANRYQSASEFAEDLRRLRQGRPVVARPVATTTRIVRWCQRNPIAAALLATMTVSLISVLLLAALAQNRLVQFRSMKVSRDIRLLQQALDSAPGPLPHNLERLQAVSKMADDVLSRLPELQGHLADLKGQGHPSDSVAPRRLLTDHPLANVLARLQSDRGAIAKRHTAVLGDISRGQRPPLTKEREAYIAQRLRDLDEQAELVTQTIAARRTVAFDDPEVEYLHDTIEDHIAELELLAKHRIPELKARTAATVVLAIEAGKAADATWTEAMEVAANDPRYGGLHLTPQPGLVPLGTDPKSGLLEFAHARSGDIPARDKNGALQLHANSCLVFVLIPGGIATVGAQQDDSAATYYDKYASSNETPVRKVPLAPFFLCKHELGHAQWERLAQGLGIFHQCAGFEGLQGFEIKPIARVTWTDCDSFCRANGFQLPTESQWEYAYRAGTDTPWWLGRIPAKLPEHEQLSYGQARLERTNIYDLLPNPFGLHHMGGNVQEWCADPMVDKDWQARPGDGLRSGSVDGDQRALRGGCYRSNVTYARSSKRNTSSAFDQKNIIGMRPAMRLHTPSPTKR